MRCRTRDDRARGSVTAEFAAIIPAVVLVLLVGLESFVLAGEQVRLQSAAAQLARELGRGQAANDDILRQVSPSAVSSDTQQGSLSCVEARAPAGEGILAGIVLSAKSCALDDGG